MLATEGPRRLFHNGGHDRCTAFLMIAVRMPIN